MESQEAGTILILLVIPLKLMISAANQDLVLQSWPEHNIETKIQEPAEGHNWAGYRPQS
jgi:hypothetical protein